jgi:hypothetical protein
VLVVTYDRRRHFSVDAVGDLADRMHVAVHSLLDQLLGDALDALDVAVRGAPAEAQDHGYLRPVRTLIARRTCLFRRLDRSAHHPGPGASVAMAADEMRHQQTSMTTRAHE